MLIRRWRLRTCPTAIETGAFWRHSRGGYQVATLLVPLWLCLLAWLLLVRASVTTIPAPVPTKRAKEGEKSPLASLSIHLVELATFAHLHAHSKTAVTAKEDLLSST